MSAADAANNSVTVRTRLRWNVPDSSAHEVSYKYAFQQHLFA